MNTVAYQAKGTLATGTTGAVSVAWPTHVSGDLALLFIETNTATSVIDVGTSWTPIDGGSGYVSSQDSPGTVLYCFYRIARSSTEASASIPADGARDHVSAIIMTVRGCHQSQPPIENVAANYNQGSTGSLPWNGGQCEINSTTQMSATSSYLLVLAASRANDSAAAAFATWTGYNSLAMTERYDAGHVNGTGGGFGIATASMTAGTIAMQNTVSAFVSFTPTASTAQFAIIIRPDWGNPGFFNFPIT